MITTLLQSLLISTIVCLIVLALLYYLDHQQKTSSNQEQQEEPSPRISPEMEAMVNALAQAKFEAWAAEHTEQIRASSEARSKAVLTGFVGEQFAPLTTEFNPKDFRHFGDPIDYLVIKGLSEARNGQDIEEIILLDIKTGNSQLNSVQRKIRDAVAAGRVRFATFHPEKGIKYHGVQSRPTKG